MGLYWEDVKDQKFPTNKLCYLYLNNIVLGWIELNNCFGNVYEFHTYDDEGKTDGYPDQSFVDMYATIEGAKAQGIAYIKARINDNVKQKNTRLKQDNIDLMALTEDLLQKNEALENKLNKYQDQVQKLIVLNPCVDGNQDILTGLLIHAAKAWTRYFDNQKYGIQIENKNDKDNIIDLQNYITIWCNLNNCKLEDLLSEGLEKMKRKYKEFQNRNNDVQLLDESEGF